MGQDRQHRSVVRPLRVHRQRPERTLAEFHLHQRVGERAEAHAAIFLRDERAPQPLRSRFLPQRRKHVIERLRIQLLLGRNAFVMHPLPHLFPDRLGLRWNFEIDRHDVPH